MELELAQCTTAHQKMWLQCFSNLEKIKEQNAFPCKFQKFLKGHCFIVKNLYIKNISDVVELCNNLQNSL